VSPAPEEGAVAFTDNGVPIQYCTEAFVGSASGTATCSVTYTSTGAHSIVASFSGDES
jgi:hypothetical protein